MIKTRPIDTAWNNYAEATKEFDRAEHSGIETWRNRTFKVMLVAYDAYQREVKEKDPAWVESVKDFVKKLEGEK